MREKKRTNRRQRSVKNDTENAHNFSMAEALWMLNNMEASLEKDLLEGLIKDLDSLYSEVIGRLVALGYHPDVALKAVLKNGYYYGNMDVKTTVLNDSLAYLKSSIVEDSEPAFMNLRHLEESLLACMVCLVQEAKPHLNKGDAMWCLIMSDLDVGRASTEDIPSLPRKYPAPPRRQCGDVEGCGGGTSPVGGGGGGAFPGLCRFHASCGTSRVGVGPGMCKVHGGCSYGNRADNEFHVRHRFFPSASECKEIECPKRFNLTPSMKTLLKSKVAAFASGFKGNAKNSQDQLQDSPSSLPAGDPSSGTVSGFENGLGKSDESQNLKNQEVVNSVLSCFRDLSDESQNLKNQEVVNSVLSSFRDLNLDESSEQGKDQLDQKDEMIISLLHQIKDLEKQMKERKDWAHKKAMQAARKLSTDMKELERLRMEREEAQRLKKGNQVMGDTTMKKLTDMETALRKASGDVDRVNLTVKKLETENAEIRAEMESCKLSASESATTLMEVVKREKKCLKKLAAGEKQKTKLQEDIVAEKLKISDLQQQLVEVEAAQKEAEAKWRLEQKAKVEALAQVEEERRFKEVAEASSKRKLETLRHKIEIDFQRHKDDLQQLEQDLSRLKASAQTTEIPKGDVATMECVFDRLEDSSEKDVSVDRECLICMNDEVSVVFLPCAHQVICANCNDNYGKKGRATCPSCRVPIEQRIRVFGATS